MPGPDENVHPEATGEAKKLVDAHQDAQDLVLYSGWVSFPIQESVMVRGPAAMAMFTYRFG
jgi:hypothetical protein